MEYDICMTHVTQHKWTNGWYHTNASQHTHTRSHMGWLRLVGSLQLYVSFAEYRLFSRALAQKRPIIWRSLLIVATPFHTNLSRRTHERDIPALWWYVGAQHASYPHMTHVYTHIWLIGTHTYDSCVHTYMTHYCYITPSYYATWLYAVLGGMRHRSESCGIIWRGDI